MIPALLAASTAALAAVLALAPSGASLVRRRLRASDDPGRRLVTAGRLAGARRLAPPAAVVVATWLVADRPHLVVLGLTAAATTWTALHLRGRTAQRRRRRRCESEVVAVCDALGAELRAGNATAYALDRVAADWAFLAPAAATARLGGDVPHALRELATEPGRADVASLAAAWEVATRSGAALAGVVERLAGSLRADEEVRREVDAALAGPRASARMLAGLPLLGLGLGTAMGGDPVGVVVGSMIGASVAAAGVGFALAGLVWVEHLAEAADRERGPRERAGSAAGSMAGPSS